MNAGAIFKIILILALLGGGFAAHRYTTVMDQGRKDVDALKLQLKDYLAVGAIRRAEWSTYETQRAKTVQAAAQIAPLKQQKEALEQKVKLGELELKTMASSLRDAVDKVRAQTTDLVMPELKLADGRILKNAKVRKFESAQISFTHTDGIGSVPVSLLPPELLERLDMGEISLVNDLTLAEADILTGSTRVAGVSLKCPVPLSQKEYPMNLPIVVDAKRFEGKTADEMEVSVSCIRYVKGTQVDLDGAVAGSVKSMSSLPGITNPRHQVRDTTISNFPAKRSSFSAKRVGGEIFAESLIVFNGEKMWMIQVIFSNKSKGASPIAESILTSVQIEPGA